MHWHESNTLSSHVYHHYLHVLLWSTLDCYVTFRARDSDTPSTSEATGEITEGEGLMR